MTTKKIIKIMAQYIDKSAVIAEIERLISNGQVKLQKSQENNDYENYVVWSEHIATCIKVLSLIDTLEVKEVDLEKESELIANSIMIEVQAKKYNTVVYNFKRNDFNHSHLMLAARKGIELGLKTKGGKLMDTNGDTRMLLLKDLCSRLPYGVNVKTTGDNEAYTLLSVNTNKNIALIGLNFGDVYATSNIKIDEVKPYLRPMSSMTEEEKKELLCTIVGNDAVKYFQVLSDGSIDNTDAAHQDLQNFTMHWINFDGINTSSYIDWLNARHFDYRGLIEKGLAIAVTNENNPYI